MSEEGRKEALKEYSLEISDEPCAEDVACLESELRSFNRRFIGDDTPKPLAAFARERDGALVAGLSGVVSRGWLKVDLLWVDPQLRGTGLGSEILRLAEERAREQGCSGVLVETYDFQARPFYEAHGYVTFATLEELPPGSRQHYLAKRFEHESQPD